MEEQKKLQLQFLSGPSFGLCENTQRFSTNGFFVAKVAAELWSILGKSKTAKVPDDKKMFKMGENLEKVETTWQQICEVDLASLFLDGIIFVDQSQERFQRAEQDKMQVWQDINIALQLIPRTIDYIHTGSFLNAIHNQTKV